MLAGLAAALAVSLLILLGSWVVLQAQIRFERKNFTVAEARLNDLGDFFENADGRYVKRKSLKDCAYTSVSIGTGSRSCSVDQYVIYSVDNIEQARSLMTRLNATMPIAYRLDQNARSTQNEISLGSYDFHVASLPCTVDYWYFTNSTLPYAVEGFAPEVESGLFVDGGCAGVAKAEYFPVKHN